MGDTVAMAAIQRGDSLDYIKTILEDGTTVSNHARLNTAQKVCTLLLDPASPPLHDAMTMEKADLEKRARVSTANIPETNEEHQLAQLDQAARYLRGYEDAEPMDEAEEEEEELEEEEEEAPSKAAHTMPWVCERAFETDEYTWARTVYYRTNMAMCLMRYIQKTFVTQARDKFFEPKVIRFINQHLRAVQYLDSLPDPRDDLIDAQHLCSLYEPLGVSNSNDDRDMFVITRTHVKIKDNPVEHLRKRFPALMWTVEQVANAIATGAIAQPLRYIRSECSEWAPLMPETVSVQTHTIYLACIYLLNQCYDGITSCESSIDRDALWAYYASFTDIFFACLPGGNMSDQFLLTPYGSKLQRGGNGGMLFTDELSPWEAHGSNMAMRAFHCGDLPDMYHVLISLPLWGEQDTPTYLIGKLLHKSLPFACQRRHIIKLIVSTANTDEAFWCVFSKLFWCMLAGLYPGDLGAASAPQGLTMRDLLRIKELTSSKRMLMDAISADSPAGTPGANGGPLVVFIAFRLHMLYMVSLNPTYRADAEQCIDYAHFYENTVELANLIRATSLFPEDAFAQARKQLSKTVKSPHSRVHRFRRKSKAETLKDYCNDALEKTIICDKHNRISDLALLKRLHTQYTDLEVRLSQFKQSMIGIDFVARTGGAAGEITIGNMAELIDRRIAINEHAIALYNDILAVTCKSAIANIIIRIPRADRLTPTAFSILTLPQYGGISQLSVQHMCTLANIYSTAMPKDFRSCIAIMNPAHLVIICFFFNMVALFERMNFVTLDATTVRRTDYAMTHTRYHVYPGQEIPAEVFNVSIAPCCGKIANLIGQGKYGCKRVGYDTEKLAFVCAHGKTMHAHNKLDNDEEEDDSLDDEDDENAKEKEDVNLAERVLEAQNDQLDDYMADLDLGGLDLIADAVKKKGRGTKRSAAMEARKSIRNDRKTFNRIPCGQPVINISLRGRALIWGGTKENRAMFLFCPKCGALHAYTILNFSGAIDGLYRCNECARKETAHLQYRRCAYCDKTGQLVVTEKCRLYVYCPDKPKTPLTDAEDSYQHMYFCRAHYSIAKRFAHDRPKEELFEKIRYVEHMRLVENAKKF